ncbi:MAG TPA: L,D-transpeptidase [Thermoleophilaceae bacterium]|nr:L,D-transpeptidase [Thermoleophilaceae bacterium]
MRIRASILLTLAAALGATTGAEAANGADPAPRAGIQAALASAVAELAEAALGEGALGEAPLREAARGAAGDEPAGGVLGAFAESRPSSARRYHRIAVVRGGVGLSERPGGPARLRVGSTTEFGSPRVLGVAARRGEWLGVVATERPNNRLAWVRRESPSLTLRRTGWSLHADLSARTVTLRKDGRRVRRMTVAIGRPGSETPTGRFSVTDKLAGSDYGPYYGCCILALSGHQPNTPPGWTGGDRLAIHGTDSPSTIGAAASAGCLRGSDADLRALMAEVRLGTPVFIRR